MQELQKLTKTIAQKEVEKIKKFSGDSESAHSLEDHLHLWFIQCVAASLYTQEEAIEVAKIVASTSEIKIARWCA